MSIPSYSLWVKQSGEGCDYTIGCGEKIFSLDAHTLEEARKESLARLDERFSNEDSEVKHAIIFTFTENVTFTYEAERKKRQAGRAEDIKKQEIQKLEAKLKFLKGG